MSAPPQKRARPAEPTSIPSNPSLTLNDLRVLSLDASHNLILTLLSQYPVTARTVTSHIDAVHSLRRDAADSKLQADIKRAVSMRFDRFADEIREPLTENPYHEENKADLAADIDKSIAEGIETMLLGCKHSPRYETRLSAYRTMMEMAGLTMGCRFEALADELAGENELADGMLAVWNMAVERDEAVKMKQDLMSELKLFHKRFLKGREHSPRGHLKDVVEVVLLDKKMDK